MRDNDEPARAAKRLFNRQIKRLRAGRALSLQHARFVRQYQLGDATPYVQEAWLQHRAILAMLQLQKRREAERAAWANVVAVANDWQAYRHACTVWAAVWRETP